MAVKGALTTTFSISATKPAVKDEMNYENLAERSITPSAVTVADDTVTLPGGDYDSLINGDPIEFTDEGNITGVATGTTYFVVKEGADEIGFAENFSDAIADPAVLVDLGGTLGTAELESSDWKECGEVVSLGEFGREYNVVSVVNLKEGATRKFKGSYNNGTVQVDLLFDRTDVGQTLLEVGGDNDIATYACRVGLPGAAAVGEEFYFEGLVTMLKRIVGGPDDAIMLRATFEIDHNSIVEGT